MTSEALSEKFPHLVHGLSAGDLGALLAVLEERALEPGEVLLEEGLPQDTLYFTLAGTLSVELGGVGPVAERGPGELFGEISLLDPGPASATVRAVGPVRLLALTAPALDGFAREHPRVTASILRSLCMTMARRNAESYRRCDDLFEARRGQAGGSADEPRAATGGVLEALRHLFSRHDRSAR